MSDSQAYEEITVSSDGVAVTKRFEADEFPVPAIAFNVVSKRTEPVTLRMVDTVPEDVAVEDLGFHPEYGSEFWDINDDQITFEKEIGAEADYTTVYGIRATGTDDVEKFLTQPEIESVDPPLDEDEDSLVGSSDDAVKDVISGDSDSVPGLEDEGEDEDIETLNLKDPNSEGEPARAAEDGEAAEDSEATADGEAAEAADGEVPTGNVIAAMANEIRQNNVSAADVKMLKRALDAVSEDTEAEGGVNTARLNRIQGDIADLRAYTDALEQFLEENGTGDEIIEEFEGRLGNFESELGSLESELNAFRDELEGTQSTVESVSGTVDELDGDVGSLENNIEDVEGTVESMEGELSELEGEIAEVREEIGEGEIDQRLSEVEDEIVELKEWREQLSSVIG